jgi:hypothetical protein
MRKVLLALAATMLTGAAYAQTAAATSPAVPAANRAANATSPTVPDVNRTATATPAPGQPAAGANSFTQGEARSRLQSNGFGKIAGLKKDESGVWRGRAEKGGQQVNVWLDYKGNIGTN